MTQKELEATISRLTDLRLEGDFEKGAVFCFEYEPPFSLRWPTPANYEAWIDPMTGNVLVGRFPDKVAMSSEIPNEWHRLA